MAAAVDLPESASSQPPPHVHKVVADGHVGHSVGHADVAAAAVDTADYGAAVAFVLDADVTVAGDNRRKIITDAQ